MNKPILILTVFLVVLSAVTGYLYFVYNPSSTPSVDTDSPSTYSLETSAPTETSEPTQPPITLVPNESTLILNGTTMESYLIEDQVYVTAESFAKAVNLELEDSQPLRMVGTDYVQFSKDSFTVITGGETTTVPSRFFVIDDVPYVPFYSLVNTLGYPEFYDTEMDISYYTPGARRFSIPEGIDVPVIMYHAVSDDLWGISELFVSPEAMDEQLTYLVENDYEPIWFEDLSHIADYQKPVILTFDDGYDDNYTELFPLLKKHQVKATIFVISDCIGNPHKMNAEQIRELSDSGLVSIQSHTHTHTDLNTLDAEGNAFEMSQSKLLLTRLTGKEPYVLCYPTGKYNDYTLELAPEYYAFGLKMVGGQYNTSDDPFLVNRYYMSRYYDINTFVKYLSTAGDR